MENINIVLTYLEELAERSFYIQFFIFDKEKF